MDIKQINQPLSICERSTIYTLVNKVVLTVTSFSQHFLIQWIPQHNKHQQFMPLVISQRTLSIIQQATQKPPQISQQDQLHCHIPQLTKIYQNLKRILKYNLHHQHSIVDLLSHKLTHNLHISILKAMLHHCKKVSWSMAYYNNTVIIVAHG